MNNDGTLLLILVLIVVGFYSMIFYYAWRAHKEKAKRVEAEIKFNEGEIEKDIDSISLSQLVKRANDRDRNRKD